MFFDSISFALNIFFARLSAFSWLSLIGCLEFV